MRAKAILALVGQLPLRQPLEDGGASDRGRALGTPAGSTPGARTGQLPSASALERWPKAPMPPSALATQMASPRSLLSGDQSEWAGGKVSRCWGRQSSLGLQAAEDQALAGHLHTRNRTDHQAVPTAVQVLAQPRGPAALIPQEQISLCGRGPCQADGSEGAGVGGRGPGLPFSL